MNPKLNDFLNPRIAKHLASDFSVEESCIIVSPGIVAENIKIFKDSLPSVGIFYAYKCFPDPKIIRQIDSVVEGYDVASEQEIKDLLELGVDGSRMVFSNPVKIPGHIEFAYNSGVELFVFQSSSELEKIAKYAPGSKVILRIKVPDTNNVTGQIFSKKFGSEPQSSISLLLEAKKLNLDPIGITFHVGSQNEHPDLWHDAIKLCGDIIDQCRQAGVNISLLDIGGGFPSNYSANDFGLFYDIANTINRALSLYIKDDIKIIAEPGRFLVADSGCLVANVIGREQRSKQEWLFLDVGVFSGLFEVFEFNRLLQRVEVLVDNKSSYRSNFILAGPTCDGDDIIATNIELPQDLEVGDKLVFSKAGAYVVSYSTKFNGMPVPKIVYQD